MPAPIIVDHDDWETRERKLSAVRSAGFIALGFDDPIRALDAIEAICVRVLVIFLCRCLTIVTANRAGGEKMASSSGCSPDLWATRLSG